MFKPKTPQKGRLENSSGERIRLHWLPGQGTTDLRVVSQNPESVPFVRRALQISRPDELWYTLAWHATVANRCSYSICFTWVRQVLFLASRSYKLIMMAKYDSIKHPHQAGEKMEHQRYVETNSNSYFGDYLYDRIVPQEHFLRKLWEVVDWGYFTERLIKLYKGQGVVGRLPFDPV